MELYRLSKKRHQDDLRGTGVFLAGGRWNNMGIYILYSSSSRSLAIVESLAHITEANNLDDYVMLVLYLPDDISRTIHSASKLHQDWKNNITYSQEIGDTWARQNESLLLQVPSAIVHKEYAFKKLQETILGKIQESRKGSMCGCLTGLGQKVLM